MKVGEPGSFRSPSSETPLDYAGWRARHVGFERDGLVLEGVDIWQLAWRKENAPPIELPHPAHPNELHLFNLYATDNGHHTVRFAATELSNGVWGFYTPSPVQDAPAVGTTADGSLRFDNRYESDTGGRPTDIAPTAWIWDAVTGETLAAGTAWTSSRVTLQPDGKLLLALRHYNRDALFRLDPTTRTFHTLGERRADESLSQLAAAIDRAHKQSMDKANTYTGLRLAPDDSLRVELVAVEWSNSHWVNSPRVIEVATGRVLLDLTGTDWDCEPSFPYRRCVSLALRRYRSRIDLRAELDLARDNFTIQDRDSSHLSLGPLATIVPALEAASARAAARAPPQSGAPRRIGARQLVVALLILIGALAAIGALSFLTVRLHPEPPQKLTPLPKMPDAQPPRAINPTSRAAF